MNPTISRLRLRRVRWKHHGMESEAMMRERSAFLKALWGMGANVSWWMLDLTVRWP